MSNNQASTSLVDLPTVEAPRTLSIKDMVVIVSVAITIALQWGIFSTRVTLLERNNQVLEATIEKQATDIRRLQVQTQDNSQFIGELYRIQNKPAPQPTNQY